MRRLTILLALCLVPALVSAQVSTYPQGGAFTGGTLSSPLLLPDGTVAAPSLAFASDTNLGFKYAAQGFFSIVNASTNVFSIDAASGYIRNRASGAMAWTNGVDAEGVVDLTLFRDAANTLALRNGVNANTLSVYSTYTDAANYVRTDIGRSPYFGAAQGIVVDGLGTGANPSFTIGTRGAGAIVFAPAGNTALGIVSSENLYIANAAVGSLTVATMARDSTGALMRTVTSSFSWTNAQVVALGAVTSGDITVATLPAKTQLLDAAVVVSTQATFAPGAFTIQCGDTATFVNYIVASDLKAAANTFYGDAVAERGTSIDVEHYYLPSYTATTTVTCRFITAGGNLNAVTNSTGKVILTTRLLP